MNSAPSVQDFAQPRTLAEAVKLMSQGKWRIVGGGTDLYPVAGQCLEGPALDVTGLSGISGISLEQGLRIGAATSWTEIADTILPPSARALQQAARVVGGRQVQNAGTIGGNLCNASPAADGVPPLLALRAEVELASAAGLRSLPLEAFLLGARRTALTPDEILTAVLVPEAALAGRSAFVKLGARTHLVISIAMAAARLVVRDGIVTEAAIAVGSCSPVASRLGEVEAALLGARVEGALDRISAKDVQSALSPIDDIRATAAYRSVAAVELVRRAVAEALG